MVGWRDRMDGGIKRQSDTEPLGPCGAYSSGSTVIKPQSVLQNGRADIILTTW